MFADPALASRIDRAEARLSEAVAAVAAADSPISIIPIGGGASVVGRAGSPINKLIGAGFDGPLDEAALTAMEAAWAAHGEPVRVELSALASPEVGDQLTGRGYRLRGFENVLGLPVTPAAGPAGVSVEVADDDRLWGALAVDGFAHPDTEAVTADELARGALEAVMHDFVHAAGFVRFIARVDGEPAGAASLRLDDDIALLCGATTAPRFRRRGVQAALLAARLTAAHAAGARIAVVTTSPGSQSMRNVLRRGFALLYARAILIRDRI
ncbi:MAG TPA: GNAT family N-acetyltransferase [Kofleriaceae bacterium]|nr:GNAT family N-acetyltransferase [Kofleriaceae bacterium]